MFNLSGTEIVVILLLALVVLGPEKLPDAIRKFGKTYAELKKMGTGFQQEFKSAIDEPMREMRETADLLKKSADFTTTPAKPAPPTTPTPKPKSPSAPAAEPVTDATADRPARNESLAPADADAVPTDDLPFADVEPANDPPVADVAPTNDLAVADVEPANDPPVADPDTEVLVDGPPADGQSDRGEADHA